MIFNIKKKSRHGLARAQYVRGRPSPGRSYRALGTARSNFGMGCVLGTGRIQIGQCTAHLPPLILLSKVSLLQPFLLVSLLQPFLLVDILLSINVCYVIGKFSSYSCKNSTWRFSVARREFPSLTASFETINALVLFCFSSWMIISMFIQIPLLECF